MTDLVRSNFLALVALHLALLRQAQAQRQRAYRLKRRLRQASSLAS